MRLVKSLILVLFLWANPLAARQDDVPLTIKGDTQVIKIDEYVKVSKDRTLVKSFPLFVSAPPDVGFYRWSYPKLVEAVDRGNTLEILFAPKGDLRIELKIESGVYDESAKKIKYVTQFSSITFAVGEVPPPGPTPPGPTPPSPPTPDPKPPVPVPVKSFRVIFVYESAKTLTSAQLAAMDSKLVRDYLKDNTTAEGGYVGYRKYDKDQDSSKDVSTVDKMWQATKPKLSNPFTAPCVAIEVNGYVEIVPLEPTAATMVEVFKKYKGGQ